MNIRLLTIFAAALAIRCSYALLLYGTMGNAGLMGFDSYTYVEVARKFAAAVAAGNVHGLGWLGPHTVIMPLFNALLTCSILFGDKHGVIAYVLVQCVFDAGTCVVVAMMARAIRTAYGTLAGIVAAVNPTQVVISGLVYPDTPFVFFVALAMLATVYWLRRPGIGATAMLALGLAAAELCRVLILPWLVAVIVLLLVTQWWRAQLTVRSGVQFVAIAVIVAGVAMPILIRNVRDYGAFSLTSQGGAHLFTVVPWVRQAYDGTPWAQGRADLAKEEERLFPTAADNPFEESRRWGDVATRAWRSYGFVPTIKAWIYGAVINLAAPAVLLSPPVIQIPRTGFYETPGRSMAEKIVNFLFHSESKVYVWALLIGATGLAVWRLLQVIGAAGLIREAMADAGLVPIVVLFVLWFSFIMAVNGPIASPKYRLPLEPLLNVITAAGLCEVARLRGSRTASAVTA